MKRAAFLVALGLVALVGGCAKPPSDADAVRTGINQHLAGLKTINLSAMDVEVLNVSVQGNQAQAQVEFRPKTGAPAGMQVSYALAKQNGVWVVQTTQPMGGSIQHPGPGENPHMTPGMTTSGAASGAPSSNSPNSTSLPNFHDLVPGGSAPNALPPGHPNINPPGNTSSQ